MAFPILKNITRGQDIVGGGVSTPIIIPTGAVNGDLVLVIAGAGNNNTSNGDPKPYFVSNNFTQVTNSNDTPPFTNACGGFKNIDGNDAISLYSVNTAVVEWQCYLIENTLGVGLVMSRNNFDGVLPPILTLPWTKDVLWFSSFCSNGLEGPINAPAGYADKIGGAGTYNLGFPTPDPQSFYFGGYSSYKFSTSNTEAPGDWMVADTPTQIRNSMVTMGVIARPTKITIGPLNGLKASIDGNSLNDNLIIKD